VTRGKVTMERLSSEIFDAACNPEFAGPGEHDGTERVHPWALLPAATVE
jgi:hypothetical protein